MEWQMSDVDPKVVIDDALGVTRGLFTERDVQLRLNVSRCLPPIHADRDRLMQVMVNLLSNAVKFCKQAGGVVLISAEERDGGFYFSVADNGPGVEPAVRRKIFEKFQQASETLADRPQGSGLGLTISRQIVEFFGGRIWVESVPGRGAKFSFIVPVGQVALVGAAD